MYHITNPSQVPRNLGLDVPMMKAHIVRELVAWRSSSKGDVKLVQLDSCRKFINQISEPDSVRVSPCRCIIRA
jgi:hypothetical protein